MAAIEDKVWFHWKSCPRKSLHVQRISDNVKKRVRTVLLTKLRWKQRDGSWKGLSAGTLKVAALSPSGGSDKRGLPQHGQLVHVWDLHRDEEPPLAGQSLRNSGHAARTEVRHAMDSLRDPPKRVHFHFFFFNAFARSSVCRILFLRQQSKELDKLKNQNSYMVWVWTELVIGHVTEINPESRPPTKGRYFWTARLLFPPVLLSTIAFLLNILTKLDTLGSGGRGPEAAPLQTVAFCLLYWSRFVFWHGSFFFNPWWLEERHQLIFDLPVSSSGLRSTVWRIYVALFNSPSS